MVYLAILVWVVLPGGSFATAVWLSWWILAATIVGGCLAAASLFYDGCFAAVVVLASVLQMLCCRGCFGPFSGGLCFAAVAVDARLGLSGVDVLCHHGLAFYVGNHCVDVFCSYRPSLFVWALRLAVPSPCLFFMLWFVSS